MADKTLDARLLPRFCSDRSMRWGAMLTDVALAGWTHRGGLPALAASVLASCGLDGLIVVDSLATRPKRVGAASAPVGAIQARRSIAGSALVVSLADETSWPLGLTMGSAGLGRFACTGLLPDSSKREPSASEHRDMRRK